jgi:subtilisin family serine protease
MVTCGGARAQVTLLSEGFEGVFPGGWTVGDANDESDDAYWADVDLTVFGSPPLFNGNRAGYCAGIGYVNTLFGPTYQSDMAAYMSRNIDLTGVSGATLSFWFIIPSIEDGFDGCHVLIDGSFVWSRSTASPLWQKAVIDLTPYVGANRTLTFQFVSDSSIEFEGWYLDDILVTSGAALPNLAPHQPAGWSSNIVISTVAGTSVDSVTFTPNDTIYLDWAVINNGLAAATTTFVTDLYVDDVRRTGVSSSPPLNPNSYRFVSDYSIGSLPAGSHTIRLRIDVNNSVAESDETDNEVTRTIVVSGTPDIRIAPLSVTLNLTNAATAFAPSGDAAAEEMGALAAAQFAPELKLIDAVETLGGFAGGRDRVPVKINLVAPPGLLRGADWNSREKLRGWQAAVKSRQVEVISALPAADATVRYRFENQAGFSVEVTRSALERLLRHPRVVSVEPVRMVNPSLAQGIPLMGGAVYRSINNGSGVSVAIVDNGVDYNHPRLGGGGFPNSKVIGGFDFGDLDGNPAPAFDAHGTACAGIVAGSLGTVGDYIGGVAHGARLYALKVTAGSSASASDDAIIAAWNWCVSHKNDDPNNPIVAISTSFGGGRYFSACDGVESAYATAANTANAAGIAVLVSSGNEGFCDSTASPSCVSGVIAVGAVFDASFGSIQGCIDAASCATKIPDGNCPSGFSVQDVTAADKVPSYSNTSPLVGLLAPANRAYTTDIVGANGYSSGDYATSFGGTSAACPYAAGAVAALQSAARASLGRFLTPAEVRARLISSGDAIADTKAAVTKPRINLARAIEGLGQSGSFTIYNDGNAPLNVTSMSLDVATPWLSWSPPAPFTIGPGSVQIVSVLAEPAAAPFGQTTRRLIVSSNDPDESPYPGGVSVTVNKSDDRPLLRASRVGNRVVVSWTTNSSGFFLYAKSPPATGIWSAVQTTPVIVGNEKFVTNAITANDVFYRLQK